MTTNSSFSSSIMDWKKYAVVSRCRIPVWLEKRTRDDFQGAKHWMPGTTTKNSVTARAWLDTRRGRHERHVCRGGVWKLNSPSHWSSIWREGFPLVGWMLEGGANARAHRSFSPSTRRRIPLLLPPLPRCARQCRAPWDLLEN